MLNERVHFSRCPRGHLLPLKAEFSTILWPILDGEKTGRARMIWCAYRFIAILVIFPIKNRPLVPEFQDHKYLTHTIQTSSVFGFKAIKRFMHYLSHPFTLSRFLMHSISKSTFHKRASIKDALRRLHFGEGVHFNKGTFLSIFYKF